MPWEDQDAREHVARTEALLSGLGALGGPAEREQTTEALQAVIALYGECLARVMRHADPASSAAIAADELVRHLLLVHDLHPDPAETRVRAALDGLRGQIDAELIAVDGGSARVRVRARGCGSSAESLRETVREAVLWAAPEVERVELDEASGQPEPALIPVDELFRTGAGREGG